MEVQAGAKDVVLRLHARARIAGRIVDAASGVPQPAQLTLVSADARNWIQSSTDGAFEFDVTPGTFALFAAASGGRIGVLHPLVVEEEEERLDLVIPLEQGALVRVVCPPDSGSLHYRMTWKGIRALGGILTPGLEGTETVPAGELELLYGPVGAEPTSSLHLRISPGELRELELRP